ncbi:patatin [Nocardioides anomalus]|uniref:Patatin n=1 Tax=Nocardioides anomalus TaxID=2712223 RepID=A0A6G6WGY0_9ACTN|nr:patatin-like phospholipase family protein [Nocardioides anomalus]QIG44494.1 patatin [Nocardioides anomalus]
MPRKLLSVDGGGVRGVVALEVLARMEQVLRDESGDPGLVLGDWFDYVGGTSTGAIIAGGIAIGLPVSRIQQLYRENMRHIFTRAGLLGLVRARYDEAGIEEVLRREFGEERTLGSPDLHCLLLLGMRNSSTGSPWPVSSNPAGRYNQGPGSNLELPLWQLVRASSAAPTFFVPEEVAVGGQTFVFSDGAVTTLNNPALQLALMATLPAYHLGWPTGRDELLLVSVGTGTTERAQADLRADDLNLLSYATAVPEALIHSAGVQNDYLCRVLGECRHGPVLDSELGDLVGGAGLLREPLFSYVRYDAETHPGSLEALGVGHLSPERLDAIDGVDFLEEMSEFGRAIARRVEAAHFDGFV